MKETIEAYAVHTPEKNIEPFEYTVGSIDADAVEIDIQYCGVCHSDLSMMQNNWMLTTYPFVGGHEVVGKIGKVGDNVSSLSIGDTVGLGWQSGYCMDCACCQQGNNHLCADTEGTIIGRHGGFAKKVRAKARSVFKLPENMNIETAGPLFCGGVTVFSPLIQCNVKPTDTVGVIGIGGLGHLALQFYRAWGCEVVAFTSSEAKKEEALRLGAHRAVDSKDKDILSKYANTFDFIISTVNVGLDWELYIAALKAQGRFHLVGALLEPVPVNAFSLIAKERSISGSPIGSPNVINKMLQFASRHKIEPKVEIFKMENIADAIQRVKDGTVRYRAVLKNT